MYIRIYNQFISYLYAQFLTYILESSSIVIVIVVDVLLVR